MDKLRVFQIATVGLLLLNVMLLGVFFFGPHARGGGPGFVDAPKHLGLDEAQDVQFITLAEAHQNQMRTANDRQTELLQKYFLHLTTDAAVTPAPLPPEITALEAEKIGSTYQHLLEVKGLLRPEQQQAYPAFVRSVLNQILLKKGKRPRPPKERRKE